MAMTAPNVVRTMCPLNGHPTFCGMLVEMEAAGRRLWAATRTIRTVKVFCVRGRATSEILGNPRRLLCPQIRDDRYTNTWRRVSWDEALDIVRRLRKVGPEAVGRWAGHGRELYAGQRRHCCDNAAFRQIWTDVRLAAGMSGGSTPASPFLWLCDIGSCLPEMAPHRAARLAKSTTIVPVMCGCREQKYS